MAALIREDRVSPEMAAPIREGRVGPLSNITPGRRSRWGASAYRDSPVSRLYSFVPVLN
ncbi:hypothetical protein EDD30_5957 [Couchioplanes caeruleus]|uniref:Uncharacterized protein n=1 Tax=Couchioplanes caeruleus TaxID=56438 RepID=A0A3N1GS95_9ACTN|nr:hypothetical protein EDD30_5957 [Couchioplanes caeruleus]